MVLPLLLDEVNEWVTAEQFYAGLGLVQVCRALPSCCPSCPSLSQRADAPPVARMAHAR